jgi:hypothetical protein
LVKSLGWPDERDIFCAAVTGFRLAATVLEEALRKIKREFIIFQSCGSLIINLSIEAIHLGIN